MVEKCVHFDIWNKKIFSKGPPYDFAHFSNLDLVEKNLKNEPQVISGTL